MSFTDIARTYDSAFSDLPHVQWIRAQVQELMLRFFPRGGRVLDLGCGTGVDADFLVQSGFQVVAADPSAGMLETARGRTSTDISFVRMPAEHLACMRDGSCDGILSNFGALNCVERLSPVFNDAYHVLRDNGTFILCLMNRFSITETVAYLQRGKVRSAFRRWRKHGVFVPVGSDPVLVWYHSLRSIRRMIRGKFIVQRVVGLNILTPPPSFERTYHRFPRLTRRLLRLETVINRVPPLSTLGDHFVVVLERFE